MANDRFVGPGYRKIEGDTALAAEGPANGGRASKRPAAARSAAQGASAREKARIAAVIDQLVASRIRQRRIEKGMTQIDLAARIGIAPQQVHKYESGMNRVSAGRLSQIAEVLGVPVKVFFESHHPTPRVLRKGVS